MGRALALALGLCAALSAPGARAADCPPPLAAAPTQASPAQDRGLLWTLQRDGRTSFLYGTLHVGKPAWLAPGPRVAVAVAGSDLLALELDPDDPAVQQAFAAPTNPGNTGDARAALSPALQARLARQVAAACLPPAALAALQPAVQALLLTLLDARWAGLDAAYAQELVLLRTARAAGRGVVALETVAMQKKLLLPDEPAAAAAMLEQALEQLESGSGRSTVARLASAWERGDIDTLERYADWCDCLHGDAERAAMRALNDERNPGLADGISALHAGGKQVFAAVGALHMTGPQSLPRLLAARGFRVERVAWPAAGDGRRGAQ